MYIIENIISLCSLYLFLIQCVLRDTYKNTYYFEEKFEKLASCYSRKSLRNSELLKNKVGKIRIGVLK